MATYRAVRNKTIERKQVLIPIEPLPPIRPAWQRALNRLLRRG